MPVHRIKLSPELKAALSALPDREKDKLLFRLLAKEPPLVERLTYELLESGDTEMERREELAELILREAPKRIANYYSPGYLLLDLRAFSGAINRHVKTTRDKEGEIQLNLLMLNQLLPPLLHRIKAARRGKTVTLSKYVVQRARKLLRLIAKLHPDLHLEYTEGLRRLGDSIAAVPEMVHQAEAQGLDLATLQRGEP